MFSKIMKFRSGFWRRVGAIAVIYAALGLNVAIAQESYTINGVVYECETPPPPGCSCKFWVAQKRHAEMQRVKDKAISREITKMNDNALGMTCFDVALASTSRLGQIFSDKLPAGGGIRNDAVFGTSAFPDMGININLTKSLDSVITETMGSHAGNFGDSLSNFLGATSLGFLTDFVGGVVDPFLDGILGPLSTLDGYAGTLEGMMGSLQGIIDLLSTLFPIAIPGVITTLLEMWNEIYAFAQGAFDMFLSQITALVQPYIDQLMGPLTSLLNAIGQGAPCSRLAALWGGGDAFSMILPDALAAGFQPLIGTSVEKGAPYMNFQDIISLAQGVGSIGDGDDFMEELRNVANQPIVQEAFDDITSGFLAGPETPGPGVAWPTTRVFSINATTDEIIECMRTGCP